MAKLMHDTVEYPASIDSEVHSNLEMEEVSLVFSVDDDSSTLHGETDITHGQKSESTLAFEFSEGTEGTEGTAHSGGASSGSPRKTQREPGEPLTLKRLSTRCTMPTKTR